MGACFPPTAPACRSPKVVQPAQRLVDVEFLNFEIPAQTDPDNPKGEINFWNHHLTLKIHKVGSKKGRIWGQTQRKEPVRAHKDARAEWKADYSIVRAVATRVAVAGTREAKRTATAIVIKRQRGKRKGQRTREGWPWTIKGSRETWTGKESLDKGVGEEGPGVAKRAGEEIQRREAWAGEKGSRGDAAAAGDSEKN